MSLCLNTNWPAVTAHLNMVETITATSVSSRSLKRYDFRSTSARNAWSSAPIGWLVLLKFSLAMRTMTFMWSR